MIPIVDVKNLSVNFNGFFALSNISFSIKKSTGTIGLISPNGAGKTTLIHSILGQIKAFRGSIYCASKEIAYCPDMPSFEPYLTAIEVLQQSLKLSGKDENKLQKISEILQIVGLENDKNKLTSSFSRGMKQRLGIAAALVLDPELLFLDEPTSSLDPFGREAILSLISRISNHLTVIISSHIIADIERIADGLLVLHRGKLLFSGSVKNFLNKNNNVGEIKINDNAAKNIIVDTLRKSGVHVINNNISNTLKFPSEEFACVLSSLANVSQYIQSCSNNCVNLNEAFSYAVSTNEREEGDFHSST